ncbi:MAG: thioredoxin-disulfide reductase [Syntrophomonadaceae bacterium]|jgi:thioredoxin reductase (NADPH)
MDTIYDILVLGGGPAGLTAGMYGARAKMKTGIIDKGKPGGQIATTQELENYPGFGRGTTGPGLSEALVNHAKSFGAEFIKDSIEFLDLNTFPKRVIGRKNEYLAKTLIYALGAQPRMLNVPGEEKLRGKGVSYCATCDAELFQDLDVAVIGSGDAAIEEADYLSKFARSVTLVVIHDEGQVDANQVAYARIQENPKIKWIWNSTVKKINGDEVVESITIRNIKTAEENEYAVSGVFIFIGTSPVNDFILGQVKTDSGGYIITDEKMATNQEGVFAAGDVRAKYLRQVITAASDGAIAGVAAQKYVYENEIWEREVIKPHKPVVVVYYNPSDMIGIDKVGIVDRFVRENQDQFSLVKVDASRNELVAKRYQIKLDNLPQLHLFQNGNITKEIQEINKENLTTLI